MGAARWTTPSLRLRSVVTGTSQLPALFKPNPTLLRPPLPSQCPTEIMEGILPHPVEVAGGNVFVPVGKARLSLKRFVQNDVC